MNPLSNVRFIKELNAREIRLGIKESSSWHNEYKDSAWVFIGGLPFELTEGDVLAVFSQYGEIVNINLVRDKATGKSKGYCFLCYEDQRSTILSVDNLNGIKLCKRTLRVDHVANYRMPKDHDDTDDVTLKLRAEGCAPEMPSAGTEESDSEEERSPPQKKKNKKEKKNKAKKQKKKKKSKKDSGSSESASGSVLNDNVNPAVVKKEKVDMGYDKYEKRDIGTLYLSNTRIKGSNVEGDVLSSKNSRRGTPDCSRGYSVDSNNGKKGSEVNNERESKARSSRGNEKLGANVLGSNHKGADYKSHTSSSSSLARSSTSLESERYSKQKVSISSPVHRQHNKRIRNRSMSPDNISTHRPSSSPKHVGSRSPDRTRNSRQKNYVSVLPNQKEVLSHRIRDLSPDERKASSRRRSISPPLSYQIQRQLSQSPNERNFSTRKRSASPPSKRRQDRRMSRSPLAKRQSRKSVSPPPFRKDKMYSRMSRSPSPKRRNNYEGKLLRSPDRIPSSYRRISRSPLPKSRDYHERRSSRSSDRMQGSKHRISLSPPTRRKYGSSRQMSKSPSPNVRSYSGRAPATRYDSRDGSRPRRR